MPAPVGEGDRRLGGCRNGYPKLGGITPMPREPAIGCMPPPSPIPPEGPRGRSVKGRLPNPWPTPPDIVDIPPDIGERPNDVRSDAIADAPRDWKERLPLPPMR
jgi:hypothetical protein